MMHCSVIVTARKKRAVTIEQCQETCVTVKQQLQQECIYDCDVLEDPEVSGSYLFLVFLLMLKIIKKK